jgi:anaerobic magnesium-protoporphyrin IX monomethyl ester cyclase
VTSVALVGPEIEENLALRYLAASLEAADLTATIIPFNAEQELPLVLETLLEDPPSVVALSLAFQWRAPDFLALAVGLRQRGYRGHVTAGGHFATFAWRELLRDFPELDSICCYEAEETLTELATHVAASRATDGLRGLAVRAADGPALQPRPQRQELSMLPWPDRRGRPTTCLGHPIAAMISGRGCYASCSFCCIAAFHGQADGGGRRVRLRSIADLAAEMLWLQRRHGVEIFVFHDDTFFLPGEADNLQRIDALAAELRRGGVGRCATIVKARPTDVRRPVIEAMRDRLGLIRVFLGVESASAQGLRTLGRGVAARQVHDALELLKELGVYLCFNLLAFDPDATPATLEENLGFMERYAEHPHNFGRVELYAGTPLLARLQREGRCRGDYLGSEYEMATTEMQRVFALAMRCFYVRNFAAGALANRLMGTRFDVEVARFFHPERYRPSWLARSEELNGRLARDSVQTMRAIVELVARDGDLGPAGALCGAALGHRLREVEAAVRAEALELEEEIQAVVGQRCHHVREVTPGRVLAPLTNERRDHERA